MNNRNKKGKTKKKNQNKSNNQSLSEDNIKNDFSILNNEEIINSLVIDEEIKQNKKENDQDENSGDIFEKALLLMDERAKENLIFTSNYEPNFSINYLNKKVEAIPIFTPSTRLNTALQIEDKSECFVYYYTQKKSLYPTIYNQLIGISGHPSLFDNCGKKEKDFIFANLTSIIFTNQKNFINMTTLINEYINPLMKSYNKNEEEKKHFLEKLCKNIIIQEYYSYEELFIKINELNFQFIEHKINNVGLVIIDGINSINPHSLDVNENENGKGFKLKFFRYNLHKYDQNSNKKNKRFSNDNNFKGRRSSKFDSNDEVKDNIYGKDSFLRKRIDNNSSNNEKYQQCIVDLIVNYQEKYNFNLILTVFDFGQDNYYNSCFGGKIAYKDNKNVYCVNTPELQKENCYFTFKLPRFYFPKKIFFIEPINLCLNYNNSIFGLITNNVKNNKLAFYIFKKDKEDYRPIRVRDKIEYDLQ